MARKINSTAVIPDDDKLVAELEAAILRSDRPAISDLIYWNPRVDPNFALHKAIVLDANQRIIQGILDRGANLDASVCGSDGCARPLDYALSYGRWNLVDVLVARGADPRKLKFFALENVIREGKIKLLIHLLTLEADLHVRDTDGNSLLHAAITQSASPLECVEILLTVGADVNAVDKNGNTPLMAAVTLLQKDTVNSLLENGAKVDLLNNNGQNAMMMTIYPRIQPESYMIALAKLTVSLTASQRAYIEILRYQLLRMLINWGADLDVQDADGNTPLMLAIGSFNRRATEELLKAALVDMRVKNKRGETVLDLADRVWPDMAQRLRDNKCQK